MQSVAVVTGATSTIGKAIAGEIAELGVQVIAVDKYGSFPKAGITNVLADVGTVDSTNGLQGIPAVVKAVRGRPVQLLIHVVGSIFVEASPGCRDDAAVTAYDPILLTV